MLSCRSCGGTAVRKRSAIAGGTVATTGAPVCSNVADGARRCNMSDVGAAQRALYSGPEPQSPPAQNS